ncbi:hypothetical protein TNCV_3216221 [Trichonephila clavipes]|nr:hypothetical protein TNCV_3216221 [Trichonephila clavipes]
MDDYKCLVPMRHGGTLNSRRAECRLVSFGGKRKEVSNSGPFEDSLCRGANTLEICRGSYSSRLSDVKAWRWGYQLRYCPRRLTVVQD